MLLMLVMLSQSADAAASVQSPQSSTVPQSADDNDDDDETQSAELKRTEMILIRQIESIQKERSLLHSDMNLVSYVSVMHI